MVKNKHANPDSLLKRKKIDLHDAEDSTSVHEVKKKRKKDKLEVPSVIPSTHAKTKEETQKIKKHTKKKTAEPPEGISHPPSHPEEIVLEGEEDLSPEERRVLKRKMKKILKKEEKKRLRDEGETAPKAENAAAPNSAQMALDYLTCWAENRGKWKFQKTRQTWLLQHMFHSEKVSDDKFSVLLEYLEGLQGAAKDTTVQKALSLVQQSGEAPDDASVQQRAHRAREVIQLLS